MTDDATTDLDVLADAQQLQEAAGERASDSGGVRAALATALVGLKKEFYGKGPVAAKASTTTGCSSCWRAG